MKKYLLLLLILAFGAVSCTKKEVTLPRENDQTLLMYMPWADNLTISYFPQNIRDMETVIARGTLKNERVLVYFMSSPTEATLFELAYQNGKAVRNTLKTYIEPAFTTAEGIASMLEDVQYYAPANRYAMTIGAHGTGWLPVESATVRGLRSESGDKEYWEYEGVPETRFFGSSDSRYQTEVSTLAEGILAAGLKMEYILFDDCYMSSIEAAYDLRYATDYLIASPTEVMAYGFPYAEIGKYLIGTVDYTGISEGFYTFYENYEAMPCGTIGIIYCPELDNLAGIMQEINLRYTFDPLLTGSVQRMCGYTPVVFFDYGDYVSQLCGDDALLQRFEDQLERTVPSRWALHTPTYYSMMIGQVQIRAYSGVTTSDPSVSTRTSTKTETAWYRATH